MDKPTILPVEGQRNVLITSALPYVNNVPHLGNLIGCVLSADVFARFSRLRGHNTLYVCGTDEYGTATETKALEEGLTPREICDKYHAIHREIYEWFDISFDHFGRTTTPAQETICQDIFWKLYNNKALVEGVMEQQFCENCKRFLADRFVEGICPKCQNPDARGDQCDKCQALLNPEELIEPRCKVCRKTPIVRSTEHLFLDLPNLRDRLEAWVNVASKEGDWSENSIQVTRGWLKDGLKPRCITRDLKWGVPVPLEKYKEKVFYVWYDAPIGYLSITANYTQDWEKWWKNDNVKLYQFMGKDNIPFHTVIFPSCLLGTEEKYTLLHHVSTTEYLNYEGGKFSKSFKTGVFGTDAKETGIPVEVWRYYLLINRPELSDTSFLWSDFQAKNNAELLGKYGNFVNRVLKFIDSNYAKKVPAANEFTEVDTKLIAQIKTHIEEYLSALDKVSLKEGLRIVMALAQLGNGYLQSEQPWVLVKKDPARADTVLSVSAHLVRLLALLSEPYLPSLTRKILSQMNLPAFKNGDLAAEKDLFPLDLLTGHEIGVPEPLFRNLENAEIDAIRKRFSGSTKEPFLLDIRVGKITKVEEHPKNEKSYVLEVSLGSETRQIVSAVRSVFTTEQLLGRLVPVYANLKQANFQGVKSQGMILMAAAGDQLHLLDVPEVSLGTHILPEQGYEVKAKPNMDFRKDFQKLVLKTGEAGVATFVEKDTAHKLVVQGANLPVAAPAAGEGAIIR